MKVFVVQYRASYLGDSYDSTYLYDSFEKAHASLIDLIKGWDCDFIYDGHLIDENGDITLNGQGDTSDNKCWYDVVRDSNGKCVSFYIDCQEDMSGTYLNVYINEVEIQ